MRVHTLVVLSIESGEVIQEEGFDYLGPLELCKGGGGSSGKVAYPDYVEAVHEDWLRQTSDTINYSVTDLMNDAVGNSPFASATPYDPDTDIAAFIAAVGDLDTLVGQFISGTSANVSLPTAMTDADIQADIDALEAQLTTLKDNRLTGTILPRFEAGMRDINSVVASAFVIGRATIESDADMEVTRDVASHGSKLRISVRATDVQVAETTLKAVMGKVEFQKALSQLMVEAYRIKIVAKKEESDTMQEYDVADAKWDLETFQYGANLLAAPSGGVGVPSGKRSTATSAIGGALSGAAMGAVAGMAMGGPVGMLAGAGAALGLGAALM